MRDAAPQATRVADHFHIVALANAALTDVRTRRQQEICGHRGRKGDALWSVRHDLLRTREHLTDRASARRSERTGGTNSNAPGRSRRCSETSTPAPTAPPPRWHWCTGTTTPAPSTSPRRTASPAPCERGNPNCSPTSTPVSPTDPPKASTGSSKPSNAKASATPTPTTTASASCPLRLTHSTRQTTEPPPAPQNAESPTTEEPGSQFYVTSIDQLRLG